MPRLTEQELDAAQSAWSRPERAYDPMAAPGLALLAEVREARRLLREAAPPKSGMELALLAEFGARQGTLVQEVDGVLRPVPWGPAVTADEWAESLRQMSNDDRLAFAAAFRERFCTECGRPDPRCPCDNDD